MNRLIGFLAILVLLARSASTAPSCNTVNQELAPCLGFIKSSTNEPSPACCSGTKAIANVVKTQADRQAVCGCLKQVLAMAGKYDKNRIPQIPNKCGVSVTLPPIDSNTDCSKVYAQYVF